MRNHEDIHLPGDVEISELTGADFSEFEDIELLELLLGLFMTREQSQVLSRVCQRRFGSLPNLVSASSWSLHRAGLSWRIILTIKLIQAFSGRINILVAEPPVIDKDHLAVSNN